MVYSQQEYFSTYGQNSVEGTGGNTCGVWVVTPSSCSWVGQYCQKFRTTTCPECKQLGGCGFCYRPGGGDYTCNAGSSSGPLLLNKNGSPETCTHPNSWIFGNWSRYYATNYWDSSCTESCSRYQARRTERFGILRLGDQRARVFYAGGSDCSWLIAPTDWPQGHKLEIILQFTSLASRGDVLRLHQMAVGTSNPWAAGDIVGLTGCLEGTIRCVAHKSVEMDGPAVITFTSARRSAASSGGVWYVHWRLMPGEQDGIPVRSFVWLGLAMVLIPILAVLLWAIWCRRRYRRRGGNFDSSLEREGVQQSAECVDLGALERTNPSCRPRIIGTATNVANSEAEAGADETGSQSALTCSVCLRELVAGDEARSLPCGHNFHRSCIDLWLGRSTKCPLCRQAVMAQVCPGTVSQPLPAVVQALRASAASAHGVGRAVEPDSPADANAVAPAETNAAAAGDSQEEAARPQAAPPGSGGGGRSAEPRTSRVQEVEV